MSKRDPTIPEFLARWDHAWNNPGVAEPMPWDEIVAGFQRVIDTGSTHDLTPSQHIFLKALLFHGQCHYRTEGIDP